MRSAMQIVLTIACLGSLLQLPAVSQNMPATHTPPPYYVIDVGRPLGGSEAFAVGIDDLDIIAGTAIIADNPLADHIFLYWGGLSKDMGTLGGINSEILGNFSGYSETATSDPLGQDFCMQATSLICLPVTVEYGRLQALPLLGGLNGAAYANNNVGEVAGISQTAVSVDTCPYPGIAQQFVPVFWKHGEVHALPMPSGDMEGYAFGVNDSGEVVGATGNCTAATGDLEAHAILWKNGHAIKLGTLGGVGYNYASAINDHEEVTGASDLAGDQNGHAFLWRRGVLTDLGTLPGDFSSAGISINNSGEIVGQSCNIDGCRPFLWEHGTMTELRIVQSHLPFYIQSLSMINDRGAVVGYGYDLTLNTVPAILAVPDYNQASQQSSSDSADPGSRIVVPPDGLMLLQRPKPGGFQSRIPIR